MKKAIIKLEMSFCMTGRYIPSPAEIIKDYPALRGEIIRAYHDVIALVTKVTEDDGRYSVSPGAWTIVSVDTVRPPLMPTGQSHFFSTT